MPIRKIEEAVDLFAHANPAFAALCLHWVCAGYESETMKRSDASKYLAVPWGVLALVLLGPTGPRSELPSTAARRLTLLIDEHPHWRAALPDAMQEWAIAFWRGLALGISTGVLALENGRVRAALAPKKPETEPVRDLRKRSTALGKVLAREGSDKGISAAVGLEIES